MKHIEIFIRPQESPVYRAEDGAVRIAYGKQWVDFKDGKVFVSSEISQQVSSADADKECRCLDYLELHESGGCICSACNTLYPHR